MSEINPWLSQPAIPEPAAAVSTDPGPARPIGPVAPQRGVRAPDQVDQLPSIPQHRHADLWLVGAHGGAGESTLAALVPSWGEAGHGWPRVGGSVATPAVVVARSHARGLRAAQLAATHWASGLVPHVSVLGLVVVADAPGRLPRALRELQQVVAGGFPRLWTVPWVEAWRLGAQPELSSAPREVRRLVDELTFLARPGAAGAAF